MQKSHHWLATNCAKWRRPFNEIKRDIAKAEAGTNAIALQQFSEDASSDKGIPINASVMNTAS
jgi:hypothetical protein